MHGGIHGETIPCRAEAGGAREHVKSLDSSVHARSRAPSSRAWHVTLWLAFVILLPATAWSLPGPPAPGLRDLAVLRDDAGTETVASAAHADAARFRQLPGGALAAGYTRAVLWLRFTVDAPPGDWVLDVLPPFLDDLRLYEPDPNRPGEFTERRAGTDLPFSAREIPYRGFAFRLHQADATPRTFFLRLKTRSTSILVPRLWSPEQFAARIQLEYGLLFAILALLLTVIVLNVNDWLWLRDPIQPWFAGYIGSLFMNLVATAGFAQQYVVPDLPVLSHYWIGTFALLSIAFGNGFYRRLLGVLRRQRALYALYEIAFWLPLLTITTLFAGYYIEVMPWLFNLVLLMAAVAIVLSWRLWRRGEQGGGFMFAANIISLSGVALFTLNAAGFLGGGALLLYSIYVSSLGTVLALHVALGRRHRAEHDERLQAQERAARAEADVRREREIGKQQGQFIDLVTHEYRTPLAVLQTNLDILALSDDAARRSGTLPRMAAAVTRLRDLFASAQRGGDWGGHRQVEIVPVDPERLLRQVVSEVESTCPGRTFRVEVAPTAGGPIAVDNGLADTVLRNLLENAAKYATAGTGVDVSVGGDAAHAVFRIANDCAKAPGLSARQLLSQHTRGANSAGQPGLGMGLYLAQKLAADMGGELRVAMEGEVRFVASVGFPRMPLEKG